MLPPDLDLYLRADLGRATILGATPEGRAWLHTFLTFQPPDPRNPDPILLLRREGFPVGLLELVRSAALRDKVRIGVEDARTPPCAWSPGDLPPGLRDYQREAVCAALRAGRAILKLATGAGKGNMISALPVAAQTTWVVLVHRSHLLDDLSKRYEEETGERAGRIKAGWWSVQRVTFATFQTLYAARNKPRAKELFARTKAIIVDEAHTVAAETFSTIVESFAGAYWKIGLSATPFSRSDSRGVFVAALLGPMVYDLDAGDLIERGTLARPSIDMLRFQHPPHLTALLWTELYTRAIVQNADRNSLCLAAAMRHPQPGMVFVTRIEHGLAIERALSAAGLRTRFVHGGSNGWTRGRVVDQLEKGELDVAVANSVFNEGVNIPSLRTVVIAAGGASAIGSLQRVGRATRKVDGKTTCKVFDIFDEGVPSLERHASERRIAYIREGYTVTMQDFPTFPSSGGRLPGM